MGSLGTLDIPKTQRAAQFDPDLKKVVLNTIPVPEIKDDEILIRTTSASLCHSDMLVLEGEFTTPIPMTIGHEALGQVVQVGSTAADRGFHLGDYVGFINAYHACWECEGCQQHYINCTSGRMKMQGFAGDGYFQEYSAIDSRAATVLPAGMDPRTASPIFCAGITAYNGVVAAGLQSGQWLAVVGCGGLGQLGIRYARAMGFRVVGIDVDDATLQTARELDAAAAASDKSKTNDEDSPGLVLFNSRTDTDYVRKIKDLTNGGCHASVVFAAVKPAYDTAPKVLRIGGVLVPVGIVANEEISLNSFDLTMKRLYIRGANNLTRLEDLGECAKFSTKHGISSPSHFFKLDQIGEMLEIMEGGKLAGYRLVVQF